MTLRGEALAYYERFHDKFAAYLASMQEQVRYRSDAAWEGLLHITLERSLKWIVPPSPLKTLAPFHYLTFPALNPDSHRQLAAQSAISSRAVPS